MERLSFGTVLEIIRFIGSPCDSFVIPCVCKSWVNVLDAKDGELWMWMAAEYNVTMHSPHQTRSTRSTSNYKSVFRKASIKGSNALREKHEMLLLQARSFFSEAARDCPKRLSSLILSIFPNTIGFDVNLTSSVVEANTLASMCSRGASRPKCLKLLLETYKGDVDVGDVGGFNPLILSAYHGNLSCVVYCVKRGANLFAMGRERSGLHLIAEHWASIRGHWDVFEYLRSTRLKLQKKIFLSSQKKVTTLSRKSRPSRCLAPDKDKPEGTLIISPDIRDHQYLRVDQDCLSSSSSVATAADGCRSPSSCSSCRDAPSLITPMRSSSSSDSTSLSTLQLSGSSLTSLFDDEMKATRDEAASNSILASPDNTVQKMEYVPDTYCVCSRGHIGSMVECDGPHCSIGWFHYICVDLTEDLPDDAQWLCPSCSEEADEEQGEGEGGVLRRGVLRGNFPEPKPSFYSSFLSHQLPNLNINSAAIVEKAILEEKAKNRRKGCDSDTVRKYNKKIKTDITKSNEPLFGIEDTVPGHVHVEFPPPL